MCAEIDSLHLVRFVLSGRERITEPHDSGVIDGRRIIASVSRPPTV